MTRTPRNQPRALVDCGCETTTYRDGSGVEIHYCAAHDAAPDLLAALRELSDGYKFPAAVCEIARAAIAKAEGRS